MNPKLYKGSLEPMILKLLSEHREMYGYEITKMIREKSSEEIVIKEGSLYPLLHRMEADEAIESFTKKVGNRMRKYYKITRKGKQESINIISQMEEYLNIMNAFFIPERSKLRT